MINFYQNFVKRHHINVNETYEWIRLIEKFINEYELHSKVYENETEGAFILIYDSEEERHLKRLLYHVEETSTSLDYIFEGRVLRTPPMLPIHKKIQHRFYFSERDNVEPKEL